MIDQHITDMIAVAAFSLSAFGVLFCWLQTENRWMYRSLGLVLLANVVMELGFVPWPITDQAVADQLEIAAEVLWIVALTSVAPLFWNYARVLTSVTPRLPDRVWLHLALPAAASVVGLSVLAMPPDARRGLFLDGHPLPDGWPFVFGVLGEVIIMVSVLQWGGYFVAIILRLLAYRDRLHQYVASTARRELTWVWVVVVTLAGYWIIGAIDTVYEVTTGRAFLSDLTDAALGLGLLLVVLLWGLRQRPGLAPERDVPSLATKYERSALTDAMSARIERKLRQAMSDDSLHRDPNLSLWSLARHIGASPNYISQTLNEVIGLSFFDFVNSYRIADAREMLVQSDETVLKITYAVGFNSRSSFYTAFRKETGQTPTQYRTSLSVSA